MRCSLSPRAGIQYSIVVPQLGHLCIWLIPATPQLGRERKDQADAADLASQA